jgi:acetyl-CoA carboxylase carboxyl transferase subunit alpha
MGIYLDFEKPLEELELKIEELRGITNDTDINISSEITKLVKKADALREKIYSNLTRWQKTLIARHPERPYTLDYIERIAEGFMELHGDRRYSDDPSIVGGFGSINGVSCMIVGHQKGRGVKERIHRNFGQPHPEGYRKALRLMETAARFKRPIITLIDTPGAYPGIGAEERGQAEAIATNLERMSRLGVPIIAIVIGEGGSGGALALGVSDRLYMLEHSTYSVISPEGCASILFAKNGTVGADDYSKSADALRISAQDIKEFGITDKIIAEPTGGAHRDLDAMAESVKSQISSTLKELMELDSDTLVDKRYERLRDFGSFMEDKEAISKLSFLVDEDSEEESPEEPEAS